jgi:hypothetical protein
MVSMIHAFAHLFVHIFVRWYTFLGTSPAGIVAQIGILVLTEVQGGWWRLQAWKLSWKGGIRRAGLALLFVWTFAFIVCGVTTLYDLHVDLVGRNSGLASENRVLHTTKDSLESINQLLGEENKALQARITNLQEKLNLRRTPSASARSQKTAPAAEPMSPSSPRGTAREISHDTEVILHNILLASRGSAITIHPALDDEAISFATRLSGIFKDAKWNVEWYPPALSSQSFNIVGGAQRIDLEKGIHCISNKQSDGSVQIAREALQRAEIQCIWLDQDPTYFVHRIGDLSPGGPVNRASITLLIYVGKRPGIS